MHSTHSNKMLSPIYSCLCSKFRSGLNMNLRKPKTYQIITLFGKFQGLTSTLSKYIKLRTETISCMKTIVLHAKVYVLESCHEQFDHPANSVFRTANHSTLITGITA